MKNTPVAGLVFILVICSLLGFAGMARAQSNNAAVFTFTTLAGTAGAGSADGVGNDAQFNLPQGLVLDGAGVMYVADTYNDTIRKVTPAGLVSTIAGQPGVTGTNDGAGSAARFNLPVGIAVDGAGNLYVADAGNNTIRKVTPAGVVSTFAGMPGVAGTNDGPGAGAQFFYPFGIALDSATNLYVTDDQNDTIRKITPQGVVSTFAGIPGSYGATDSSLGVAQFQAPGGIALDSAGNLYVADSGNNAIRMITPGGVVSTIAGTAFQPPDSADGTGSNARFRSPTSIAPGGPGVLYVADSGNSTIRVLTLSVAAGVTNWTLATLAGNAAYQNENNRFNAGFADGTGTNALFNHAFNIALDRSGNIYAADYGNNAIRKITSAGVVSTLAGVPVSAGSADGTGSGARFNNPWGVTVDAGGNLFVGDRGNSTVREITPLGVVSTLAGTAGDSGYADGTGNEALFRNPSSVAVAGGGAIYVADPRNFVVRFLTYPGVVSSPEFACGGCLDAALRFFGLQTVAAGVNSNFYVVDGSTLEIVSPSGGAWSVTNLAGSAAGFADGTNTSALFNMPQGIALDGAGNVYVADTGNHVIRKVTPAGLVTTLAGLPGSFGSADGAGTNAQFNSPHGVAVDSSGNVFVTDCLNDTIRMITLFGVVSTVGGMPGVGGSADGPGSQALFYHPVGIAVDGAENLYVADFVNNTIRKGVFSQFTPANPVPFNPALTNGQLEVTLLPPEAGGQWRFPWESAWRDSGTTATNLSQGEYVVEFRNIQGYLAIPLSGPVGVTNGGTTFLTNQYYPTIIPLDTASGGGSLTVIIGPSPPNGAGWRFLGDTNSFYPPNYSTNLLAGTYLIQFAPVAGFATPASLSVQVLAGQPTVLQITYLLAQAPPNGVLLPVPVPSGEISDLTDYPFGFNGQLQTDAGYGSGVAVETNVVLTAAHLIFNDQTLAYVNQAYWFYQQEAGMYRARSAAGTGLVCVEWLCRAANQ